jgi:hypothetical protein
MGIVSTGTGSETPVAGGVRGSRPVEDDHGAAAARAALGGALLDGILVRSGGRFRVGGVEQPATERELGRAVAIGEEAIVADAVEAVRQGVHQEAAGERVGAERHELRLAVVAIILPAEGDVRAGQADQSGVGDGDEMGMSAEVGQHLGRAAEGRLGIDDPVDLAHGTEAVSEGSRLGKAGEFAEEAEITGFEGSPQLVEEQPAEEPRARGPAGKSPDDRPSGSAPATKCRSAPDAPGRRGRLQPPDDPANGQYWLNFPAVYR